MCGRWESPPIPLQLPRGAEQDEIDIVFPIINKMGMGITRTRAEMKRQSLKRSGWQGVYAMKVQQGAPDRGSRGSDQLCRALPGMVSLAVGVVKEEELKYDYRIFQVRSLWMVRNNLRGERASNCSSRNLQGCGQCVEACLTALRVRRARRVDHGLCLQCGYCSPACPESQFG